MSNHKTVVKTFRLDSKIVLLLSKTSKQLGVSGTEFVSKILKRDLILEPLIQNIDGIGMSKGLFQEILSRTDSDSLELLGSEITKNNVPLSFELLGLDFSLNSVIYFLEEVLQPLRWFRLEIVQSETIYEFKLFHNYNLRWSYFLRSCLFSIFEFVHEEPEVDLSERVVKLRLSRKPHLSSDQRFELLNLS